MSAGQPSLQWRLVLRLSFLQAIFLILLAVLIVAALWATGSFISLQPEDETIDAISQSVGRSQNGALVLKETPALAARREDVPGLWFVVRDRSGATITDGNIPLAYTAIGGALDGIGQARFGSNLGGSIVPAARLQWVSSPAGEVQVLTGVDGSVSLVRILGAMGIVFFSALLPLLIVTGIATLIAAPLVVRRTFSSLDAAVARAGQIDINRQGMRLPVEDVPREILPLVDAVNEALSRLDQGYERQRRLFCHLAHEWRTPVAILQARLDGLPAGPLKERLFEDTVRLATLAEQFLDLQRLNHRFEPASINLVEIAEHVVSELAPLAIAANYEPCFIRDDEVVGILGDRAAIERAVTNLVQNAIQHGGRSGRITVQVGRATGITVTDEGSGIPREERARIFEPFHRLKGQGNGFGLGLNLVEEIVRLHGGEICVLDGPTGGAAFRLSFPIAG
ncbi:MULTISPECIES: HAMP domain-containing sensor histidine kinase [unclassified Rhizobium]|uniref:sensor histidine kinase n=1 Tax=unclassified Rhizobium TaxID=2613769 RepID=UPI00064745EE|nr:MULTISPECIES: HAMP domain-containing sensor histidine kinase [unclassified Rhizobium]MBN8953020.1 HAMP domain-containing histidine kinase [Rhizobium tropici]OJY64652.1 MAG: histidine kinase [Rhizobium sp. 60-20]RKD72486.1 signal transduction histidine kinase [Rhizobium sp. WW_1]